MVKVNNIVLKNFLKAGSLDKIADELVIQATAEGLVIESKDPTNLIAAKTFLNKTLMSGYDINEGHYGLRNIKSLISFLEGFNGNINFDFKDNRFVVFNEKKNGVFSTMSPEFIQDYHFAGIGKKLVEFDPGVNITKEELAGVVKSFDLLGDVIEIKMTNDKGSVFSIKNDNDIIEEKLNINYKNIFTSVGNKFKTAYNILNGLPEGKITLSILECSEKENPIKLSYNHDGLSVGIMLAPMSSDEEVTEENTSEEIESKTLEDDIDSIL